MNINLGHGSLKSVSVTLVPSHDTDMRIRVLFEVVRVMRKDGSLEAKLVMRDAPYTTEDAGVVTADGAEAMAKTLRDAEAIVETMFEPGLVQR